MGRTMAAMPGMMSDNQLNQDSKFAAAFDALFTGADIRVICTPIRAPRANAIAERFIGTLRRECLDHLLISNSGSFR